MIGVGRGRTQNMPPRGFPVGSSPPRPAQPPAVAMTSHWHSRPVALGWGTLTVPSRSFTVQRLSQQLEDFPVWL